MFGACWLVEYEESKSLSKSGVAVVAPAIVASIAAWLVRSTPLKIKLIRDY